MINNELCDKGYNSLRYEVVRLAIEDYKKAIRGKKSVPGKSVAHTKKECERFFLGDHIHMFCDLDGQLIIDRCNEEYQRELEEKAKRME